MKKLYTGIFLFALLILEAFPATLSAQCLCSGGQAATAVTYYKVLPVTNVNISTISFPLFDPSIGTLNCVSMIDTISGITTTHVENTGSSSTTFSFLLTVANNITGPGVNVNEDFTKTYGPDVLTAAGTAGDSVKYGPDSIFSNVTDSTASSNIAPYLGSSGNVNYQYQLNGGLISLQGGLNYNSQIVTNYWGSFKLIYYWCPTTPLANSMADFTAFRNGNNIQLQWQMPNEQNNIRYTIEYSTDGVHFISDGDLPSKSNDNGMASYQYLFPLTGRSIGIFYFKVKRMDATGKYSYTMVKSVNLENTHMSGYEVYPNPATNLIMLEFDEVQSGNFQLSLLNTEGQVIQQNEMALSGINQIHMDLSHRPATGMYYLQAKDLTHHQQYISKIFIK